MPAKKKRNVPDIGTQLQAEFGGRTYRAEVVAADAKAGTISLLVGKTVYTSPSGAAKAITGTDRNGWVFWGIEAR